MRDDRLLAGDEAEVGRRQRHLLGVVHGFADAHVQHDLLDGRHFEKVFVAELLDELLANRRHNALSRGA